MYTGYLVMSCKCVFIISMHTNACTQATRLVGE